MSEISPAQLRAAPMRAIVITRPGGPEVLELVTRPKPVPGPDEVLIAIRAFGLNRAEIYFREGLWGEVAEVSGIEAVGEVVAAPGGDLKPGQKVIALLGGMGRSRNGSYAEFVTVPRSNVVAIETPLDWAALAALPESYATAWVALTDN